MLEETLEDFKTDVNLGELSSVPLDIQMKIISWFLFQEGLILPEIICRLTGVYKKESVDVISVSLYLQGLQKDELAPEFTELDPEDNLSDSDYKLDNVYPATDHIEEASEDNLNKKLFKSRRKVVCKHCNKVQINKYTLDNHILNCHPELTKPCNLCDKVYGLSELLDKHIRVKHDTTERVELNSSETDQGSKKLGWKCSKCEKVFRSKKALNIHSFQHLEGNYIECDICNKKLRNPLTLEKHKLNFHSESDVFSCSTCGEKCSSRVALKQHLSVHGFVCKTCAQVFETISELEEHTKTHTKTIKCEKCLKPFSTEAALKIHIKRIHLKELKFSCSTCNQTFSSKADLKVHNIEHSEQSKPVFVCEECGKCYSSSAKLKTHVLYYHLQAEKPFQCEICQKKFVRKPEKMRHMERHSAEPMHPCKECGKKFFTKNDMLRHVRVVHEKFHAGSCDLCGRKFLTVGGREWTQHMNSHNGVKTLSCPLCPKTFFTDETLKCHMISHYDTMYWSCGICRKNFKRIKNVKYHLRAIHLLVEKDEVKKQCIKLQSAPTKAEIQQLAEERNRSVLAEQDRPEPVLQEEKTEILLQDFKTGITTTYEINI